MLKIAKRSTKRSAADMTEPEKIETSTETSPPSAKMLFESFYSGKLTEAASSATETLPQSQTMFVTTFYPGKRLVMSRFNGQTLVHVREYHTMGDHVYPTKKGVCFTPGRLAVLRRSIEDINSAIRQQEANESCGVTVERGTLYKAHLGAGIYASVDEKYNGVSLRRHWMPEGQQEAVPTRNGIFLSASQWTKLLKKMEELETSHPELLTAQECALSHQNQMGMIDCRECMPFGWNY